MNGVERAKSLTTTAAIIDQNGRVQAHFTGIGAEKDAAAHLRTCHQGAKLAGPQGLRGSKGTLQYLDGAKIVTGRDAEKAIRDGRI